MEIRGRVHEFLETHLWSLFLRVFQDALRLSAHSCCWPGWFCDDLWREHTRAFRPVFNLILPKELGWVLKVLHAFILRLFDFP